MEHLKLNRRLYLNDTGQNSNRVRAYSVGSKSKIPRCDLQRVVLVEDNRFDTNRSQSNISKEGPIYGTSTNREKKSTSAPLLSLKNQINQDRMSDLMEIDFSQSSKIEPWTVGQFKRNVVEVPKTIENVIPKSYRNDSSNLTLHATSQKDIFNGGKVNTTESSSEGGYLEMKPVGNAFSSSPVTLPSKIEKLKLKDNAEMPVHEVYKVSSYNIPPEKRKEQTQTQTRIEEKTLNSQLNEKLINTESANVVNITPHVPELKSDKKNNVESLIIENNNWDLGTADEKKLVHSISSEDYTQIKDKLNDFTINKEVGYQILQIKSDSSLISSKITLKNRLRDNLERQQRLTESVSTTPDKSPSAASKGTFYSLANNYQNEVNNTLDNILQTKDLNFPSRPSSQASQPELHYAKLDLPNCSDQNPAKYLKRGSRESPPVATCAEDGNTYARIDFDQSDSSSSSSKIFNM